MKAALLALFALIKAPLVRMLSSLKFWTLVLAVATTQGAKHGLEVDENTYWTLVGMFGALLGAQGLQDLGKERAKIEKQPASPGPNQSGFAKLDALVWLVGVSAMCSLLACAWLKSESKHVAAAIVDCTTARAKAEINQYGGLADAALELATGADGKLDKAKLKSSTKSIATDIGKCVLADAVARALQPKPTDPDAPQSSPLTVDALDLRAAWHEIAGEQTFRTPNGVL